MSKLKTGYQYLKNFYGERVFKIILASLLFHLLAVFFSEGFHRPDEHLGLMRFTGYKLGILNAEEALSSWEYPARIRPWFPAYFYYYIGSIPMLLGIKNPFVLAFLFRLVSSLIAFSSHLYFFNVLKEKLNNKKTEFYLAMGLFLTWFLPFFHARTSSENLSASLFIIGLSILMKHYDSWEKKGAFKGSSFHIALIAFFWALSFIFRYQMIAMSGTAFIWIFFKTTNKTKILWVGTLVFLLTNAFSAIFDYFGYGEWVFPPYHYLYENIFEGKAAQFGTDPIWYFFTKTFSRGIPPLSLLFIVPSLWFWWKKKSNILSWCGLAFLVIHSLIGHKEIRFIFPMIPLVAVYFAFFMIQFNLRHSLLKFFFWQNAILLVVSSIKPAHSPIGFYKFLYHYEKPISKIYTMNLVRDQLKFYQKRPIEMIYVEENHPLPSGVDFHVLSEKLTNREEILARPNCKLVYSSYPDWVVELLSKYRKRSKLWSLIHCQKPN